MKRNLAAMERAGLRNAGASEVINKLKSENEMLRKRIEELEDELDYRGFQNLQNVLKK